MEVKPWSCHVRGDIMREVTHGIGRAHGRPWEVEVSTLGFVKSMGGGGMVEVVEVVEVYLLNKYTRHPAYSCCWQQTVYYKLCGPIVFMYLDNII